MKKFLIAFWLLAFSQMIMAQTVDEYKNLFRQKIEIEKSGSSIVAVFVDEKGARFVSFGNLSKDASSKEANETTIYEIGSITKLFVGVLLADAAGRGEVKLDDPISKYLPKTVNAPKFDGREITLLDLATHTSGLPKIPDNLASKEALNPYADYTAQNLYDFLSNYKSTREIGARFEYSNLGVGLLGHILSLRTKMSLEELMTKRIFKPLGMSDTSLALAAAKKARHAQGYNQRNEPNPFWTFDSLAGAGAIRTTASDMAKFIAAGVGITKTSLFNAFVEAQKIQRQGQNTRVKIGLCWNNIDLFGTEFFWHGGGTYGFTSYITVDPKQKKGAFLVHNSGKSTASGFLESVAFNYLQPKYPIEKPQSPKSSLPKVEITLSEDILQKYVGEYLVAEGLSIFIDREGKQLYAGATGEDKFKIFPEKEDVFFAKIADITISFKKDADEKIVRLIINQDGVDIPARKVK